MFRNQQKMFFNIIKWFLLATVIGALTGAASAVFLNLLDKTTAAAGKVPYYYLSLPLVLVLVRFFAQRTARKHKDFSTNAVINKINSYKSVSVLSSIKAFFLPILSISAGASAGKEAPCADVGAGLASLFSKIFKLNSEERRKLMICGVSAGFAGVFGVPVGGAIFGLEVLWVGRIFYEVMFPAFIAGVTAFQVTRAMGVTYLYRPEGFVPLFTESFFIKVVVAGIVFGLVSVLFIEVLKLFKIFFRWVSYKTSWWLSSVLGGLILVCIALFISPDYLGLGMEKTEAVLLGAQGTFLGMFLKMVTTSLTFAAGAVGGLITPVLFVGAQAGSMLSIFLEVDGATLAALGVCAVLAGTTNAPLASSIIAVEMFGPQIAPYASVACVISFLMTGERSMFSKQKISFIKDLDAGKEDDSANTAPAAQKTSRASLASLKKFITHLIPQDKD